MRAVIAQVAVCVLGNCTVAIIFLVSLAGSPLSKGFKSRPNVACGVLGRLAFTRGGLLLTFVNFFNVLDDSGLLV